MNLNRHAALIIFFTICMAANLLGHLAVFHYSGSDRNGFEIVAGAAFVIAVWGILGGDKDD